MLPVRSRKGGLKMFYYFKILPCKQKSGQKTRPISKKVSWLVQICVANGDTNAFVRFTQNKIKYEQTVLNLQLVMQLYLKSGMRRND